MLVYDLYPIAIDLAVFFWYNCKMCRNTKTGKVKWENLQGI